MQAYIDERTERRKRESFVAGFLAYSAGCTWPVKGANKATPEKFRRMFDGERTFPGNAREQREAWERELDEKERLRKLNGSGSPQ